MNLAAKESRFDNFGMMASIAQNNPHISLSDIAFLMGVPYEPEPGSFDVDDLDDNDDYPDDDDEEFYPS